jgi:hypothetical protein
MRFLDVYVCAICGVNAAEAFCASRHIWIWIRIRAAAGTAKCSFDCGITATYLGFLIVVDTMAGKVVSMARGVLAKLALPVLHVLVARLNRLRGGTGPVMLLLTGFAAVLACTARNFDDHELAAAHGLVMRAHQGGLRKRVPIIADGGVVIYLCERCIRTTPDADPDGAHESRIGDIDVVQVVCTG